MRELVIQKLLSNAAKNCCEWNLALQDPDQYPNFPWQPLWFLAIVDARGKEHYTRITRENLEELSDETLLKMLDADACLKYR